MAALTLLRPSDAYYGFDKCGSNISYSISGKNILHRSNFPESASTDDRTWSIRFTPLTAEHASRAAEIYATSAAPCFVERGDEFDLFLQSWSATAWAAVDEAEGALVGYLVGDSGSISEVHGESVDAEVAIISAWIGGATAATDDDTASARDASASKLVLTHLHCVWA